MLVCQGRGRTESGSSAVSESGSGVLEPPPTPEGSSLASIQAASALYSSSLNDRIAPSFKGAQGFPTLASLSTVVWSDDHSFFSHLALIDCRTLISRVNTQHRIQVVTKSGRRKASHHIGYLPSAVATLCLPAEESEPVVTYTVACCIVYRAVLA